MARKRVRLEQLEQLEQVDPLTAFVQQLYAQSPKDAVTAVQIVEQHKAALHSFLQASATQLLHQLDTSFGRESPASKKLWELLFLVLQFPNYLISNMPPIDTTTHASGPATSWSYGSATSHPSQPVVSTTTLGSAITFVHALKTAYPPPSPVFPQVLALLRGFKDGHLDIDGVYEPMMSVLKDRQDLQKHFLEFLPTTRTPKEREAASGLMKLPVGVEKQMESAVLSEDGGKKG